MWQRNPMMMPLVLAVAPLLETRLEIEWNEILEAKIFVLLKKNLKR